MDRKFNMINATTGKVVPVPKYHAMKANWTVEALDGGQWAASYPGHFTTDP
jgi:hypothetical protein